MRTCAQNATGRPDPVPEESLEVPGVLIGGSQNRDLRLLGPFTQNYCNGTIPVYYCTVLYCTVLYLCRA